MVHLTIYERVVTSTISHEVNAAYKLSLLEAHWLNNARFLEKLIGLQEIMLKSLFQRENPARAGFSMKMAIDVLEFEKVHSLQSSVNSHGLCGVVTMCPSTVPVARHGLGI